MSEQKQRIEYIDLAKGICILLVVFHHCRGYFEVPDYRILRAVTFFMMPLFFFLSGLVFNPYESYLGFLKRKINKLIIPFLFFHVIWTFLFAIIHEEPVQWHTLYNFLYTQKDFLNGPVWFLVCLFWLNQMFYGIYAISFKTKYPLIILGTLSVGIGILGFIMGGTDYNIKAMNIGTAMSAMPFFCAGFIFKHQDILRPARWDKWLLPIAVVLALYTFLVAQGKANWNLNIYEANAWITYSCAFSGVLCILAIAKTINYIPIISYFGRYSIMLLVTHIPLSSVILPKFYKIGINNGLLASLLFVTVIALSYLVWIPIMKRYLPYVTAQKDLLKTT
jgi:fucose 4-O-acetylase-like acetyltransferase